jgi:hypothetical protein
VEDPPDPDLLVHTPMWSAFNEIVEIFEFAEKMLDRPRSVLGTIRNDSAPPRRRPPGFKLNVCIGKGTTVQALAETMTTYIAPNSSPIMVRRGPGRCGFRSALHAKPPSNSATRPGP